MKILLLTFSFNYNFGAILQTYATVKYLQSQGHEVDIPNYHPSYLVGNTSFYRGVGVKRNPVKGPLRRIRQFTRYRRFDGFRKSLPIAHDLNSREMVVSNVPNYDVVMTGSDQTWNTNFMKEFDSYFYQGFFSSSLVRKVSYASCFGAKKQKESFKSEMEECLLDFHSIAARNEMGVELVKNLISKNPPVVVDPTLLYDFDEFKIDSDLVGSANNIFAYCLDKLNFDVVENIVIEAKKHIPNLMVDFVNGEKNFDKPSWAESVQNNYGPVEFLKSMQKSRLVVTDSFHGAIFASKFSIPTVVFTSGWRSERIKSLMIDLGSLDCLIVDGLDVSRCVRQILMSDNDVDLTQLKAKIEASKEYIRLSLLR